MRILALNLFEVSPRATQLRFLLQAAGVWRESFPDDKLFWVEQGVGARIAAWIEALCHKEPSSIGQDRVVLQRTHALLAHLVALGVPEARQAEETLVQLTRQP